MSVLELLPYQHQEDEVMAEEDGNPQRRKGELHFEDGMRAADTGLQISRRFVETFVLIVGFGVTIGMNYQKFNNLTDKVEQIGKRVDVADDKATKASIDAGVALALQKEEKDDRAVTKLELEKWRSMMAAIAMIQQQGGGRVTLTIPERPRSAAGGQ